MNQLSQHKSSTLKKRLRMVPLFYALAALLGAQSGCILGFGKRARRERSRKQRLHKAEKRVQRFLALTTPSTKQELLIFYGTYNRVRQELRSHTSLSFRRSDEHRRWAARWKLRVDTHFFQKMVAAIQNLSPHLASGGHTWLAKLLWWQSRPLWRGPKTDLLPLVHKTNLSRITETQQTFSEASGYFRSRGCVATLRPLPRLNQRLPITFHLHTTSTVYVRCYLKSTVAALKQGHDRFRLFGFAHLHGRLWLSGQQVSIDANRVARQNYVDFSFKLDRVLGRKTRGAIRVGLATKYVDGYRREYRARRMHLKPNYRGKKISALFSFAPSRTP